MTNNQILKALSDWNFWGSFNFTSLERPGYIKNLERLFNIGEIITVHGIRRAGKSTIINQFIQNMIKAGFEKNNTLIINLEDPRFSGLTVVDLQKIYETYVLEINPSAKPIIVLDEAQEVKEWEKFARMLHETGKAKVIVSGSSSKLLSEEYATLLSGRHIDIEVFPLSFWEFLEFKKINHADKTDFIKNSFIIKRLLKEYLTFGGFPKICTLTNETDKRILLSSYFQDILISDIQKRHKIREVQKLVDLAKYYMTNLSTLQSCNKISKNLNMNLNTVERFSSFFSTARLLSFVNKFSYSYKSQLLSQKKVYAIDQGLRSVSGFQFSEDMGRLLENSIYVELLRRRKEVYYYKTKNGYEVDFCTKDGLVVTNLIQVCFNLEDNETKKREIKSLVNASKETGCKNLVIITFDEEGEEILNDLRINITPFYKFKVFL